MGLKTPSGPLPPLGWAKSPSLWLFFIEAFPKGDTNISSGDTKLVLCLKSWAVFEVDCTQGGSGTISSASVTGGEFSKLSSCAEGAVASFLMFSSDTIGIQSCFSAQK